MRESEGGDAIIRQLSAGRHGLPLGVLYRGVALNDLQQRSLNLFVEVWYSLMVR